MRPGLNKLELIEKYLEGTLNADERAVFEEGISSGDISFKDIEALKHLKQAARNIYLKEQIGAADQRYRNRIWLKRFLYTFSGLIVLAGTVLLFQLSGNDKKLEEKAIVQTETAKESEHIKAEVRDTIREKVTSRPSESVNFVKAEKVGMHGIFTVISKLQNDAVKDSIMAAKSEDVAIRDLGNASDLFKHIYNRNALDSQIFVIDTESDTTLNGFNGTKVYIPAGVFKDRSGRTVYGPVTIILKEAFAKKDMVLYNLTTTTDGQFLESGGMVYINARRQNEDLQLAPGSHISFVIPTIYKDPLMLHYVGVQDGHILNWVAPEPLLMGGPYVQVTDVWRNAPYAGKKNKGCFLNLPWRRKKNIEPENDGITRQTVNGNLNPFKVDSLQNYIFQIRKMGWANIDRLHADPQTQAVKMVTLVDNQKEFNFVYITLIFKDRNMYLPGYQKKDGTYSFTHGDYEDPQLPVGDHVYVLATAYKEGKPWFDLKEMTLTADQSITLHLEESTREQLYTRIKMEL